MKCRGKGEFRCMLYDVTSLTRCIFVPKSYIPVAWLD